MIQICIDLILEIMKEMGCVYFVFPAMKKKLLVVSKKKDCHLALEWIESMANHVYWIGASTPEGNTPDEYKKARDIKQAKFNAMANHVQGIHHHNSEDFPECLHSSDRGRDTKYMKPGVFCNITTHIYIYISLFDGNVNL